MHQGIVDVLDTCHYTYIACGTAAFRSPAASSPFIHSTFELSLIDF